MSLKNIKWTIFIWNIFWIRPNFLNNFCLIISNQKMIERGVASFVAVAFFVAFAKGEGEVVSVISFLSFHFFVLKLFTFLFNDVIQPGKIVLKSECNWTQLIIFVRRINSNSNFVFDWKKRCDVFLPIYICISFQRSLNSFSFVWLKTLTARFLNSPLQRMGCKKR